MSSNAKIGIYFCTCEGKIEKVIDIDSLAKEASEWSGVTTVHKDALLCSDEVTRKIRDDVEKFGLDRLLISACSPFFKMEEFSDLGINKYLVERMNIREQCSMVHGNDPENATKKAKAMLRVFFEKARYSKPLEPLKLPVLKSALVIGGGMAGINASIDIAGTDNEVFLIEKGPFLGGKVAGFHKYFPRMCPPSCGLELMFSRIKNNPDIHVLTSSEIDTISGSPGNFEVLIKTSPRHIDPIDAIDIAEEGKATNIKVGAIILATGWEPFDPTPLTEFGYGRLENIVTNMEFERIAKEQKTFFDEPKKVAFIQCVGSRDERHLPYCSDVCCMVSIKQALFLKEVNHENEVYIFYNDIRTPGEYEELYQKARTAGVIFIKGIPSELRQDEPQKVNFSVFDTVAGERLDITTDMVVLATGMKPSQGNIDLKDKIGIALNKNNFIESHLQCYPQDTQREGIFSAGCCRAPMDVSRSIESAGTAAVKTLQFFNNCTEIIPDNPAVNTLKCDVCKRCIEECPFRAYSLDEKGFPKSDIMKCRRCGICMGGCPLVAISLGELSIEQLSEMLDAIDKSYFGEDEPLILGFLCKNDAYRAVDDVGLKGIKYPPNFLGIMVPCAGAVNGAIIAKAISTGVDGILIAGCPDNQCHYVQGSALAKARLTDISNKLREMYLEPERVRFISISRDESEKFAQTIMEYVEELKKMGRNPLRI